MNEEIKRASDMIQNFLGQQPQAVSISTLRKNLPLSFTVLTMGLKRLAREGRLSVETLEDPYSCRILLKR